MRSKLSLKPYIMLLLALLLLLSFSKSHVEHWRYNTASLLTPLWNSLTEMRLFLSSPLNHSSQERFTARNGLKLSTKEEMARIKLENQMLVNEIHNLREVLKEATAIASEIPNEPKFIELAKNHRKEVQNLLTMQLESIPARVIFRSRLSWNSSLWLNVGENDNALIGKKIIVKDSPVVMGTSVVGVIDYVGKKQSRMRLITDSGLTPSVRVLRGSLQDRWLGQQADLLIERLARTDAHDVLMAELKSYKENLLKEKEGYWHLAKGELQGSIKPFWRSRGQILKGIGFNYDFSDEEGPARELRSGKPIDNSKVETLPILKVNDLLVTTGMDGVFPPGLFVAEVTKINPLREGDYYYELEARPTAGNLDDLTTVFILPPVGYDPNEQPPYVWE